MKKDEEATRVVEPCWGQCRATAADNETKDATVTPNKVSDCFLALQAMYDATTALLSVAPTGRIDEGATQDYHDAMLALTNLRAHLRSSALAVHDERYWKHGAAS